MHWLPLVAMVIASALPFPRSPAPRPITAAAEPGRNFSNDRANNSNKYNSQSNSSFESKTDTKNSKQNHATVSFLDNSNTSNESLKNSKQLYNVSKKAFSVTTASNQTDKKSQLEYNSPTSIKKLDYDYEDKKKHEEYLFLNNKSRNNLQSDYTQRDNTYQGKDNAITEKKLMTSHPENQKSDGDQSQSNDISPDSPKTEDYKSQDITTHEGNHLPGSTQKDNYHSPEVMSEEHYEMTYVSNQEHHNPQERIASINKVTQDAVTPVGPYYRLDKQSGKEGAGSLGGGQSGAEGPVEADVSRVKLLGEADLLFLDTHPRVLFSPSSSPPTHPPLLLMLEAGQLIEDDIERGEKEGESVEESNAGFSDAETGAHSEQASPPKARPKRSHTTRTVPRETSVCDARSQWVMDKETAIDDKGQTVTVMKEIQTQKGALKQYFYETRCLAADYRGSGRTRTEGAAGSSEPLGVSGGSCRGVDKKQWVSQCKQKQSFVRALTKVNNLVGWRWIRIDSSCVCVLLSRVSRAETEGGMWRERATKTGRWG